MIPHVASIKRTLIQRLHNRFKYWLKPRPKGKRRRRLMIAAGLFSTSLLSVNLIKAIPPASATQLQAPISPPVSLALSPVETPVNTAVVNHPVSGVNADRIEISLSLTDLIRNTIRYVQISNISNEEEVALGDRINRMLLTEQYQRYPNESVNRYVTQLGQQLVEASDKREIPYQFQVVVSDNINAFAIPGGYVYVTTGLLRAADNEAQLASVLAHEIAHINERHSIEALQQAALAEGIVNTVGLDMNTLAQLGYQLAINLPRGREAEYEADREGLQTLQAAGYPPSAFTNFLEKLRSNSAPPEFLSTHPTSENRIEEINQEIAEMRNSSTQGTSERAYQQAIYPLN